MLALEAEAAVVLSHNKRDRGASVVLPAKAQKRDETKMEGASSSSLSPLDKNTCTLIHDASRLRCISNFFFFFILKKGICAILYS